MEVFSLPVAHSGRWANPARAVPPGPAPPLTPLPASATLRSVHLGGREALAGLVAGFCIGLQGVHRGRSPRCYPRRGRRVALRAKQGTKRKPKSSHASKSKSASQQEGIAPPRFDPAEVFCLDVECVATGRTHLKEDRTPCSLALVDGFGKTVMTTLIKPDRPVVSYLTPFTGLHAGDFEKGKAKGLTRAINELKAALPKNAVMVGQVPDGDVEWMQLTKGVDFRTTVNLADVFRNDRGLAFSLRHEARVLLGKHPADGVHDPCWDAAVSVELYHVAVGASPKELQSMRYRMTHPDFWPPKPSVAKALGYVVDGVCLSGFQAKHCICGKPVFE